MLPLLLLAAPAVAQADERLTRAWIRGFDLFAGPAIFIPLEGGSAGYVADLQASYGLDLGPVVLSPGVNVPLFWLNDLVSLEVMGVVQAYLPMGPIAPYARVGGGAAITTGNMGTTGGAFRGGLGICWYTEHFSIGAEASYNLFNSVSFFEVMVPLGIRF